jgi:hypothetical protein
MNDRRLVLASGGRGRQGLALAGIFAAAILAAVGFGTLGCARPGPGTAKTPDELLTQLKQDRTEIDTTTDTKMKRIDEFNASRKSGERTLQFSEIFSQDLSPEQRDVLNTLVAQEKDVSYKALLQKIITDRDTIRGLQENVMRLEQTLPDKFVVAKRGDRHHDLAMTYLTEEAHVDAAKAKTLLSQIDQTDELVPGNKVWFFYDQQRDTFRTYVTQGEAGQTPLVVRRAKQRQLITERDTFKTERDTAQAEVTSLEQTKADLEATKTQLESDVNGLTERKTELEGTVDKLSNDIATRENSLYYHAANEQILKDQGVLSSVLKKVRDVKGLQYDASLDLRQGTIITLLPRDYGLTEIRSVRLLPEIYQEGRDFTITTDENHSSAKLIILDPDIFRGKEVLLSIRG